jgi:hypothetical protein
VGILTKSSSTSTAQAYDNRVAADNQAQGVSGSSNGVRDNGINVAAAAGSSSKFNSGLQFGDKTNFGIQLGKGASLTVPDSGAVAAMSGVVTNLNQSFKDTTAALLDTTKGVINRALDAAAPTTKTNTLLYVGLAALALWLMFGKKV